MENSASVTKSARPTTALEERINRLENCANLQQSLNGRLVNMEARIKGPQPPDLKDRPEREKPSTLLERLDYFLEILDEAQNDAINLLGSIEEMI